ncbi:hypothetical protein KR059_002949, partial [Drosophila kikkawai]
FKCNDFLKKTPAERLSWTQKNKLCVKCLSANHTSKTCTRRNCFTCNKGHNTLLHLKKVADNQETITAASVNGRQESYVLLATARVIVVGNNGQMAEFRALLDSGSQINAISERAIQKLSLKTTNSMLKINGIGGKAHTSSSRVNVEIKSKYGNFASRLEAMVMPHIVADQPTYPISTENWKIPNITLADPNFGSPGKIDLLIGAEHYFEIMLSENLHLHKGLPRLQNTKLGWIVAGKILNEKRTSSVCAVLTEAEKVDEQLEKFWELDNFQPEKKCYSPVEKQCKAHFLENIQRAQDSRFIVQLAFLEHTSALGESRDIATRRFLSLEKRLQRDHVIKEGYINFMKEYEELGHMKEVPLVNLPRAHYFIPHHCVL